MWLENRFYAPSEVRPQEDGPCVSGASPLLKGMAPSDLKRRFGWDLPPPVKLLQAQIKRLQSKVNP